MYKGAMTDAALEAYFTEVLISLEFLVEKEKRTRADRTSLPSLTEQVADASPIPVLLYNFPGISNGLDLDVPLIRKLAKHKNIVGIKLSCGSVGKAVRLLFFTSSSTSRKLTLDSLVYQARLTSLFSPSEFAVYGGLGEFDDSRETRRVSSSSSAVDFPLPLLQRILFSMDSWLLELSEPSLAWETSPLMLAFAS